MKDARREAHGRYAARCRNLFTLEIQSDNR